MSTEPKKAVPTWYEEARKILKNESNLDEASANAILQMVALAAESNRKSTLAQSQKTAQEKRVKAAKRLLESYHLLKASVRSGIESTADLLDDSEMQLLMQREESVKNQQVRSLAMQAATNRVLLAQIENALREMKTVCHSDRSPRFRRQFDVLYSRYIRGWAIEAICTEYGIERSYFFRTLNDATLTFSTLLFGATLPENPTTSDFETMENCQKEPENSGFSQLKLF